MSLLYDEKFISLLFTVLIAATPAAALLGGLIHSRAAKGLSRQALVLWIVLGAAGPANYALWHLYNAIEDHWGLDRVKPLLINFAIFVALGLVVGLILRRLLAGTPSPENKNPPSTKNP